MLADAPALPSLPSPVPESAEADEEIDDLLGDEDQEGGSSLMGALQAALLTDPSDYTVADDITIEVHPLETLGHYADWLGIRTQRLRDINGLAFRTPVEVGKRIKLDIGKSTSTISSACAPNITVSSRTPFFVTTRSAAFRNIPWPAASRCGSCRCVVMAFPSGSSVNTTRRWTCTGWCQEPGFDFPC